ncbi:MAG: ribosome biogenesis GTPase YlqF [Selenomonadaceae bacterium]|nr:ribosome biogenesis GTPase YlqF [Selenomonadaceae bacterium]
MEVFILNNIQWFPGHMKKTRELISDNLKLVDLVIEVLDARIPISSQNPLLKELLGDKPKLIALNKSDLAANLESWLKFFSDKNISAVAINSVNGAGIKNLIAAAKKIAAPKTNKLEKFGAKPRAARAMIVGVPNVGKSSLINKLAGVNRAKAENRPAVTRSKQWIKIDNGLDLLDTPGILYPKFEDKDVALKLAWTYAINDEVLDIEQTVCLLLETLAAKFPAGLMERFKLENIPAEGYEILNQIGKKRGALKKGGEVDSEKTARLILSDFRAGKICKVILDDLPEIKQ